MKIILAVILGGLLTLCFGQVNRLEINEHQFYMKHFVQNNEWETKDSAVNLYRLQNSDTIFLLKFFTFQDGGRDCNNLFWSKEKFEIKNDRIIFLTHFYQKTGIDPIPEWRKQIYQVNNSGALNLIYDKYKYYESREWVDK